MKTRSFIEENPLFARHPGVAPMGHVQKKNIFYKRVAALRHKRTSTLV